MQGVLRQLPIALDCTLLAFQEPTIVESNHHEQTEAVQLFQRIQLFLSWNDIQDGFHDLYRRLLAVLDVVSTAIPGSAAAWNDEVTGWCGAQQNTSQLD
jgi:hypothetical protein